MIDTYHIDDLDGAVTLFKSTDEGTETIAVFDEEHREAIQDLLAEVERLRKQLDHERNADSGSVSNERIWEQIDTDNRLAAQRVRERLGIEVKETKGEGGYVKYPAPGCGLDSETGRFNMEDHEWVNATERPWLDAVVAEVKRLRSEPTVTVDDYHKKGHLYVTVRFPDGDEYVGLVEKWEGEEE